MRTILVTTCTGRKKIVPLPSLIASTLPIGSQEEVSREWQKRLKTSSVKTPASDVYCGRGFAEILGASREDNHKLHIISAGLGLIPSDRAIPSYNLTISAQSQESIQRKISGEFHAPKWWRSLNKRKVNECQPLASLISKSADAGFVFSLSRPYAEMVVEDLLALDDKDLCRVRILGLSHPDYLPNRLRQVCMPYDWRFDGPDSVCVGTRSDFPQRVAVHFVRHIFRHNEGGTPQDHARLVKEFLDGKRFPVKVKRASLTDTEIRVIIQERWEMGQGSSSKMLRVLRDNLLIACEQKRFAQLFKEVKAEQK